MENTTLGQDNLNKEKYMKRGCFMFEISKNNINPKIISRTFVDGRTYFEIEYFDKEKNESCIGFGSFERSNCEQWLKEYFITEETNEE